VTERAAQEGPTRLLQHGGMSYKRARTLTGKLCEVISQCRSEVATARRARSQEDRDKARADRAAQVDADLRRLWGLYPGLVGSVDGWLSEPFRLRNRRANALRTREREDERKRVRKRLMRQLRRDRERMRQRQEAIERGSVVCRARTIEEVLAAADASESEDEGTGGRPGSTCEECTDRARREVAEASSFLPFFRVCDHQYRRRKRRRTQRPPMRQAVGQDTSDEGEQMADSSGDEGGSRGAGLMAAGQVEGRRACLVAAGRRRWRDRRSRRRERRRQRQMGGGEVEVTRGRLTKRKGGRVFRRVRRRQKAN